MRTVTPKTSTTPEINSGGYQFTTTTTYKGGGGSNDGSPEIDFHNSTTHFPPFPALRCLGDLADVRPVVVVDGREQAPLTFTRLESVRATLQTGDYSFRGGEDLFAVERKTVDDLTACCTGAARDRFFRELHRLRGFRWKRLLVVGSPRDTESHLYVSRVSEKCVFATLAALEARFDVPVVWESSPAAAALRIESWAYWAARELVVAANDLARAHGLTRRQP